MKTFLKTPIFSVAFATILILSSCGGGSHWKGDATTEEEKLAKKTCDCIGKTLDERGVNSAKLLEVDRKVMSEDRDKLSEEEFDKKYAEFKAEREKMRKGGEPECMKAVEEEGKAMGEKIDQSKMEKALEEKCDLAKIL